VLIRHENGRCIFLQLSPDKQQLLCRIHSFKPSCCLEWKPSLRQPECQEGLKRRWNLTIDPSGKIGGPRANLEQFAQSINLSIPE
jgi:hypothetical protein